MNRWLEKIQTRENKAKSWRTQGINWNQPRMQVTKSLVGECQTGVRSKYNRWREGHEEGPKDMTLVMLSLYLLYSWPWGKQLGKKERAGSGLQDYPHTSCEGRTACWHRGITTEPANLAAIVTGKRVFALVARKLLPQKSEKYLILKKIKRLTGSLVM